jgi:acetyl-CoA C-acetyltransferase
MSDLGALDPRTPVIVGVGQLDQRTADPAAAREPVALLADAVRLAATDSGSERLVAAIDTIAVIRILSTRYSDPAALVAADLGITPRRRIATDDGGNYPQSLLNRACREIASGEDTVWAIGGAESWRNRKEAAAHWTVQDPDAAPTDVVLNAEPLAHPGEWAREIYLPIEIYPLFENALRAAEGRTIDEQRDRIAALWSSFSAVAAGNPNAWIQERFDAAILREPSPANRMVGFPYTKLLNANNAVDQAACFVVCSVERARALGVPTDRWVFPWAGTDAHEHWYTSHRWSLAEAPAIRLAGRGVLDLAGIGADDVAHVDVYSCFPSAVQIAAKEIGLGDGLPAADGTPPARPLTVTGGLSFAGGPWNNYVSHSIATMVDRLRHAAGATGLVTANGGFLTKHAFGVYSTTPPPSGYRHRDHQAEVDALPRRDLCEVVTADDGPVTVESAVVMHDGASAPQKAIVAALLADGRRAWGSTTDADAMARFVTEETAGRSGAIDPEGVFRFES